MPGISLRCTDGAQEGVRILRLSATPCDAGWAVILAVIRCGRPRPADFSSQMRERLFCEQMGSR